MLTAFSFITLDDLDNGSFSFVVNNWKDWSMTINISRPWDNNSVFLASDHGGSDNISIGHFVSNILWNIWICWEKVVWDLSNNINENLNWDMNFFAFFIDCNDAIDLIVAFDQFISHIGSNHYISIRLNSIAFNNSFIDFHNSKLSVSLWNSNYEISVNFRDFNMTGLSVFMADNWTQWHIETCDFAFNSNWLASHINNNFLFAMFIFIRLDDLSNVSFSFIVSNNVKRLIPNPGCFRWEENGCFLTIKYGVCDGDL
mmetsp:Transcript_17969/g.20576  ORF Transcript_17969/g.20576 Transcript_17969/m.20576 type:complete len:257 (-) Transcript_17969:276-1046(-)